MDRQRPDQPSVDHASLVASNATGRSAQIYKLITINQSYIIALPPSSTKFCPYQCKPTGGLVFLFEIDLLIFLRETSFSKECLDHLVSGPIQRREIRQFFSLFCTLTMTQVATPYPAAPAGRRPGSCQNRPPGPTPPHAPSPIPCGCAFKR